MVLPNVGGAFGGKSDSAAIVTVNEDGNVTVLSGAADTGQGSDSLLVQIAAEELGIEMQDIIYVRADTDVTPADMGNYSSRETVFAGNAVRNAAVEVKKIIMAEAAEKLEANVDDVQIGHGKAFVKGSPDRAVGFKELVHAAQLKRLGAPIVGHGTYDPPDKINYATYSFGGQVADVEVEPETGEVEVLSFVAAHDVGKSINPTAVEGQLEGCIHLSLGWVLIESFAPS